MHFFSKYIYCISLITLVPFVSKAQECSGRKANEFLSKQLTHDIFIYSTVNPYLKRCLTRYGKTYKFKDDRTLDIKQNIDLGDPASIVAGLIPGIYTNGNDSVDRATIVGAKGFGERVKIQCEKDTNYLNHINNVPISSSSSFVSNFINLCSLIAKLAKIEPTEKPKPSLGATPRASDCINGGSEGFKACYEILFDPAASPSEISNAEAAVYGAWCDGKVDLDLKSPKTPKCQAALNCHKTKATDSCQQLCNLSGTCIAGTTSDDEVIASGLGAIEDGGDPIEDDIKESIDSKDLSDDDASGDELTKSDVSGINQMVRDLGQRMFGSNDSTGMGNVNSPGGSPGSGLSASGYNASDSNGGGFGLQGSLASTFPAGSNLPPPTEGFPGGSSQNSPAGSAGNPQAARGGGNVGNLGQNGGARNAPNKRRRGRRGGIRRTKPEDIQKGFHAPTGGSKSGKMASSANGSKKRNPSKKALGNPNMITNTLNSQMGNIQRGTATLAPSSYFPEVNRGFDYLRANESWPQANGH